MEKPLKEKLAADLKAALKAKASRRISVLRMMLSDLHNQEIAKKQEATDSDVMKVLSSAAKKHEDSIAQFATGNRPDLVAGEREELEIIKAYLPKALSDEELDRLVGEAITDSGATEAAEFGKVMKVLMPKIAGRASGQIVSEKLKAKLN
jgi:hypothetical protein